VSIECQKKSDELRLILSDLGHSEKRERAPRRNSSASSSDDLNVSNIGSEKGTVLDRPIRSALDFQRLGGQAALHEQLVRGSGLQTVSDKRPVLGCRGLCLAATRGSSAQGANK
jgi:hypothetical protein